MPTRQPSREPSVVERHIARHVVVYGVLLGVVGVLSVVRGFSLMGSDPVLGVIGVGLGVWVALGPWTSWDKVRRWDSAGSGGSRDGSMDSGDR